MDPISAIFVMVVLGGLFAKGVDVATDGLLSAEVGGGVRGAGGYAVRAGRARWRLANAKAREIRGRTPQGRAVQQFIDTAGMFGRVLFGGARRFGSGVRSAWGTGRTQACSARTERRGEAAWPVTEWLRSRLERANAARAATPNEPEPNAPNGASSEPEREPNTTTADDPNDPNGDPNVPLPSTVPDTNGDVKCGCCAQLHKPLAAGAHCPNCHIHDGPNAPTDTIPNAPTTRGPSMDINSAPAAIAAAEALRGRFEEPESLLTSLSNDAVSTLEGMGDFGTGDETDTAGRFQPVLDALGSAREAVDVYVAALHEEWDEHIAAAEGRTAGAHAPFQEV